jgi:actin-related protein 5
VSSDEEEDLGQLQAIEQKLLAHDPSFTKQHTHASILSRRSELLTAFKPAYEEGNIEGAVYLLSTVFYLDPAQVTPGYTSTSNGGEHANRGSHLVWQV